MDSRLQNRRAHDMQFRLQRPADRSESPRQRCLSHREKIAMGSRETQSHERARGGEVDSARVSEGMEIGVSQGRETRLRAMYSCSAWRGISLSLRRTSGERVRGRGLFRMCLVK